MATAVQRISGELDQIQNVQPNTDVIKEATQNLAPGQYSDRISTTMADLVKGRKDATTDHAEAAEHYFRKAIDKGHTDPVGVAKGLSPQFSNALQTAFSSPQALAMQRYTEELTTQLEAAIGKNISLTSPLSTGLVPYDLSAPAKLIYPVYSPFRNLIPRVQGQGTQHLAKIVTAISGALPGGLGTPGNRMSIAEFNGQGFSNYPITLPGSGTQTVSDIAIPYRFFGLTESVSWLAQFAGQGFQDAAGLASLVLLQEAMLLEERALIGATSVALATPAAPGVAVRTGNTGEAAVTGATTTVYVVVTALNYYGETVGSTAGTIAAPNGTTQVLDVTIAPVSGALAYNVYLATGAANPGRTGQWLYKTVGANKVTITGALPTSGSNPPAADTGTSSANDYVGLVPAITGQTAGTVYPTGFKGSYVNQAVGDTLNVTTMNNALQAMWNGSSGIFADPDDLWCEGGDLARFGAAIAAAATTTAGYRLLVDQAEVNGMRAGAAVSDYVNPITRKIINMKVHPYLPQGTAMLLSWKLPNPIQNVNNVWEVVNVQDYLSISWPVIDITFRYSLFWYGSLFSPAVQYNGILQGIQQTTATSTAGTFA